MGRARDIANLINSNTFITPASASATYLSQTSASSTYAPIAAGSLVKITPTSIVNGIDNGIGTISFNGVTSVSLNNVFSSTYTSYRIILTNVLATTNSIQYARLRVSGSDNTTSNYFSLQTFTGINNTNAGNDKFSATTQWIIGNITATGQLDSWYDIWNPNAAALTQYSFTHAKKYDSGYYNMVGGGTFGATTSFDGITIYTDAGTFSGTISVYGYRN